MIIDLSDCVTHLCAAVARVNVAEQRLLGAQLCNGYGFKDNNRSGFVRDNDGMGSVCSCR